MIQTLTRGVLTLCLFFASFNLLAQEASMTLDDFVALPTRTNFQISPDGKHLSAVVTDKGKEYLVILDAETKKLKKGFSVPGGGKGIGEVYWVNNSRLVYTVTERYAWDKQLHLTGDLVGVNIDGSQHEYIFGMSAGEMQTGTRIKKKKRMNGHQKILDLLENDERHILIAFYPWKIGSSSWVNNRDVNPTVYKLNVYNGNFIKEDYLPMPMARGITDNNGITRFSVAFNKQNELVLSYKEKQEDEWKTFQLENFDGVDPYPLSFTKDNKSVYLAANVGEGTNALYKLDLSGNSVEKMYHNENVNISEYIKDFANRRVIAVGTSIGKPEYFYLDKKDKKAKLHRLLLNSFQGYDVTIVSVTQDESKIIVRVDSDTNPGDYYLFETEKMNADFLATTRPKINLDLMNEMQTHEFTMRDGTKINGFVTLPKNADKNLPLVVLPHGGPHGYRDWWGFDWEVQLFASFGYAVLQVNFRGSGGFGTAFQKAGYGTWGTLMQDDVTDATKALIEQGIADPQRICIYGGSYGGYAALMGTVREPELYRCAIGSVGVYDLPMMFEEGDIPTNDWGLNYLRDVLGEDIEDQKRRSPTYNANKIKANIFLIHGEEDERAPIEHAEAMMEALDKAGKKYEWLKLGNEGHGYYDEGNRKLVYGKIIEFLEKNIGSKNIRHAKK